MAKTLLEDFILRRASIYATPGTPTDTLKRVYGDCTDGALDVVPCVLIQQWDGAAMVYQIADHPISNTAPTVYANDMLVTTGYAFSASTDVEGHGAVAILTFTVDETGRQIGVKCKGALNGDGALIENLAEIVRDIVVTTHGLSSEWDSAAYTQAFTDCATLGYLGGGVILDDGLPANIADGIMKPVGVANVGGDGKLRLFVETLPSAPMPEDIFKAHECEATLVQDLDAIVNDILLSYRFNWRKRAFASLEQQYDGFLETTNVQSIAEYKTRSQTLEAPWLRTAAAATAAVTKLLALRARPRWDVTLALSNFKAMLQQPADVIAFTSNVMPGGAAIGQPGDRRLMRVRQVRLGWSTGTIELQGYDLEQNHWITSYLADGIYLADGSIKAGASAANPE
jgi:hypothetical protein